MLWANGEEGGTLASAENLSRMEKYTTATAASNGDFIVDYDGASRLAAGDIIRIAYPSATDNTKPARQSIDGGSTYINIFAGIYQILAKRVENKDLVLTYDGTQFKILDENTMNTIQFGSGVDLDDIDYNVTHAYCTNVSNRPIASNGYFNCTVLRVDTTTYRKQEYVTINGNIYTRVLVAGVWGDWTPNGLTFKGSISSDFNGIVTTGMYMYGGGTVANKPPNFGIVLVFNATTYINQTCIHSSNIYIRNSYDGGATWTSWVTK
jgi:hypothetical protein